MATRESMHCLGWQLWFLTGAGCACRDSVFVKLGLPVGSGLDVHFQTAQKLADDISKTFRAPNDLEFEKVPIE